MIDNEILWIFHNSLTKIGAQCFGAKDIFDIFDISIIQRETVVIQRDSIILIILVNLIILIIKWQFYIIKHDRSFFQLHDVVYWMSICIYIPSVCAHFSSVYNIYCMAELNIDRIRGVFVFSIFRDNANRDPVQAYWQRAYKIDDSELDSRQSCESRARERTSLVLRRCGATWGKSQEENLFARSSEVYVTFSSRFFPPVVDLRYRVERQKWCGLCRKCDGIKQTRSKYMGRV